MGVSTFPAQATSSFNAFTVSAALADNLYQAAGDFISAIYRVSCVDTTVATVAFISGNTVITEVVTTSGVVDVNLSSDADKVIYSTDTGADVLIAITRLAQALPVGASGTLDTVTSSGNYSGVGVGVVVAVGGGGGGGGGYSADAYTNGGGGGGGSGGVDVSGVTQLNGTLAITIGAAGNGGSGGSAGSGQTAGNAGGATSAGAIVAANGGGGGGAGSQSDIPSANPGGTAGAAGSPGGGAGAAGSYTIFGNSAAPGTSYVSSAMLPVSNDTTGGAGGGGGNSDANTGPTNGKGSGIGTGGNGGNLPAGAGNAGTGYGAGGGGGGAAGIGGSNSGAGAVGTPGVVYVIRF